MEWCWGRRPAVPPPRPGVCPLAISQFMVCNIFWNLVFGKQGSDGVELQEAARGTPSPTGRLPLAILQFGIYNKNHVFWKQGEWWSGCGNCLPENQQIFVIVSTQLTDKHTGLVLLKEIQNFKNTCGEDCHKHVNIFYTSSFISLLLTCVVG